MWSTGFNSGLPGIRDGKTGASPTKGCEGDERAGAALVRGEEETSGTVQHKEEKAQGKLSVYKYLEGRHKEDPLLGLGSGLQWCPRRGPEATDSKWNTGSFLRTEESTSLLWGCSYRCPERLWVSTLGDIQKPSGNSSAWLALGGSAWAKGFDQIISRGTADLKDFTILEFCRSNDSRCWGCFFTRVRN